MSAVESQPTAERIWLVVRSEPALDQVYAGQSYSRPVEGQLMFCAKRYWMIVSVKQRAGVSLDALGEMPIWEVLVRDGEQAAKDPAPLPPPDIPRPVSSGGAVLAHVHSTQGLQLYHGQLSALPVEGQYLHLQGSSWQVRSVVSWSTAPTQRDRHRVRADVIIAHPGRPGQPKGPKQTPAWRTPESVYLRAYGPDAELVYSGAYPSAPDVGTVVQLQGNGWFVESWSRPSGEYVEDMPLVQASVQPRHGGPGQPAPGPDTTRTARAKKAFRTGMLQALAAWAVIATVGALYLAWGRP